MNWPTLYNNWSFTATFLGTAVESRGCPLRIAKVPTTTAAARPIGSIF